MKKFRYRLQPLLNVKQHLERERQREHALATAKVIRQKEKLTSIAQHRNSTLDTQRSFLSGPLSLNRLLSCTRYLLKLRKDILSASELLHALERESDQTREKLVAASRTRKVYERLREIQYDSFLKDYARLEQKESDEIAGNNYRVKTTGRRS